MKSRSNRLINEILLPLKLVVPQPIIKKIPNLTTNEEIRIENVLKYIPPDAYCLDIGCGTNLLIKKHRERGGKGIGVDVYDWGDVDLILEDSSRLPFKDEMFDCVTFVASLNHIPNRQDVLREAGRVLKKDGTLIITNLFPLVSRIWHKWAFWDKDQHQRGMKKGEVYGFTNTQMHSLVKKAGFYIIARERFSWKINNLYICKKIISLDG